MKGDRVRSVTVAPVLTGHEHQGTDFDRGTDFGGKQTVFSSLVTPFPWTSVSGSLIFRRR